MLPNNGDLIMDYLPLILLAVAFLSNKDNDYKQILKGFSTDDICEILRYLGIKEELSSAISSLLPTLLSGEKDIGEILKMGAPLIFSYFANASKKTEQDSPVSEEFPDLSDIAGDEIGEKFKQYFA